MITCRALPYQKDPIQAFNSLRHWSWPILLDSQDAGRWDILSAEPCATAWQDGEQQWHLEGLVQLPPAHTQQQINASSYDPFTMLQHLQDLKLLQLPTDIVDLPFHGGVLGYIGYAASSERGLPQRRQDEWPLAALAYYEWALCTDHQQQQSWLVCQQGISDDLALRIEHWGTALTLPTPTSTTRITAPFKLTSRFQALTSSARYEHDIGRIHDYIRAGDCYQVNYTQAWEARYSGQIWSAYSALREAAKAPYACYWQLPWGELLSLSPEQFLAINPNTDGQRQLTTRPIKGTRRRASDPTQDLAEATDLLNSAKDMAENVMITDLLRNDLSKHAELGSVHVSQLCALESFGQVHHLVSTIHAQLSANTTMAEVLRDAFPGGSITGAPKKRAMEIIEDIEVSARGVYCGSIILCDCLGYFDSSITIRTVVAKDGIVRTWAGGGITADSNWAEELQECLNKMGGLMHVLEQA